MRRYIRHPSDIPIEFDVTDAVSDQRESLNNVSLGGLSFQSKSSLPLGTLVTIRVPLVKPPFQTRTRVIWCKRAGMGYDIGVELVDREDAFRTRMVEQVCHIEHYKREVLKTEGRRLSGEEAALEWIGKYAHLFPVLDG
jgi:hypothetical protein